MTEIWRKPLTPSDAQQEGGSHDMALRLTKSHLTMDNWQEWFRETFFAGVQWRDEVSSRGRQIETARVPFDVTIDGDHRGTRHMLVDYDPQRLNNNHAPTTHLHYDDATKAEMLAEYLVGYEVVLERDDAGNFSMTIQAAA